MSDLRKIYLKSYNDHKYELDARISEGIEKHKKGSCKVRFLKSDGTPFVNEPIKITQKSHDFKYGANIFMLDEFESVDDNAQYRQMFKEYFNLATIPFYWDTLEPIEGSPRYAKDSPKIYRRPSPDLCVEYCEENNIDAKLHCLVYEGFIPDWLKKMSLDEVKKKYYERMEQISEKYVGKMVEFEVINEILQAHRWDKRGRSPLTKERDVEEWAFHTARKYFPQETLVINEGTHLTDIGTLSYRAPYFLQCENLLLKGASIDKIGIQHHIFAEAVESDPKYRKDAPYTIERADVYLTLKGVDTLAALGLPLEITEVTIPTFGDSEDDEELQAQMLKIFYSVWFSHPSIDTIVYWNTVDGYCHTGTDWNENNCRGGLFHHDLTPKKSALMLKKLFDEEWHTDLELITDADGYIEFKGFFGDYSALVNGRSYKFGLHKNQINVTEISI